MHMVQLMPLHPKTPSSLASFKSRLVLPFWYQFTQVVLEKRVFNGCSISIDIDIELYYCQVHDYIKSYLGESKQVHDSLSH